MTEQEYAALSIAIGVLKRESMFENAEIIRGLRRRLSLGGLKCTVPPEGWECSREAGHEGPCAASMSADNPAQAMLKGKSCRTGHYDICHAAKHDGVVCPEGECDIDNGVRSMSAENRPAQEDLQTPRYDEWRYLREHGQWSNGVPEWARDYSGSMNDFTAATAVIEELAAIASQSAKEPK